MSTVSIESPGSDSRTRKIGCFALQQQELDSMAKVMSEQADVQVGLTGVGGERRFVIQNVGGSVARDIHVEVLSEKGKNSPVVSQEVDQKFPLEELGPDESTSLSAIVTTGTGIRFLATVTWQDVEGVRQRQSFQLTV